jgi:NitT/TauT family transport system substrate-binding protein
LVDIDAARVPDALRRGVVDAGETWNPYLEALPREGYRVLYTSAETPGLIQDCIATRESVAAQSPAALRELVRAWTAAAEWTIANPDSARRALRQLLNRDIPSFADSTGVHLLSLQENWQRLADTLPISLERIGRKHADFLGRVGALRAPARIDVLVDSTFLPARVTSTAPTGNR